ncbi:MAG: NF038122 family metalloprotease, partial [Chthoniobacteraceae bacterium]
GASDTTFVPATYAQVKSALASSAVSPADMSSVANLPASDPAGPGGWSVPSAEAKALGLLAAADPGLDGTIFFGAGYSYTYDPANRKVPGKYDFIGVALHEISEVMGRNTNLDEVPVGAAPFDLFRYTAKGAQSMDPNATKVYFSVDGGATSLNMFNSVPSGDIQDWAGPVPDAFNAFGPTNEEDDLTQSDITAMDVIGYTPLTYTIATGAAPVAGGSTGGGGKVVTGASVTVTATPASGYSFMNWTESGTQVSTAASYAFTASMSRTLVANFILSASDANLSSIVPGAGMLSPAFAGSATGYSVSLAKTALTFRLTPVVAEPGSTVTVNGAAIASGNASTPMALAVGTNAFSIVVTAPDRVTTKTYTVTVTRSTRNSPMDLNNDAKDDFVFQNTAGQLVAWYMNGSGGVSTAGYLYSGGLGDWKLVGKADLNGDGNTDLVFQNTAGQVVVWYLNGSGGTLTAGFLSTAALGDWKIVGIADMDNDGHPDIVLQNAAGQIAVWYLNGSGVITSGSFLYSGDLGDWRVAGIADLNGDGNADLIFQNTAGQIAVWYLNGSGGTLSAAFLSTAALGDWKLVAVEDLNADGNPDLILQNSAGQIAAWYTNGAGVITLGAFITTTPLGEWRVR